MPAGMRACLPVNGHANIDLALVTNNYFSGNILTFDLYAVLCQLTIFSCLHYFITFGEIININTTAIDCLWIVTYIRHGPGPYGRRHVVPFQ